MAINGCLLDFCLNGSKVPTTVRPAHYAKTCCNLRTLATRGIQLKQFSASHVAPVWPLRTTTKVAVPLLATHPVHAWSTGCSADIIKHIDYAHSKDADSEVDPSHSSAHDQTSWEDCEEHKCNNTNAVDGDVTLNSDSGLDITNAEDTMKLQNMKKIRRNKVKVSERVRSKSHKKRSGRTCPQPDVVQDQAVVHPAALTTVDAAWDNVQLPVITPLSEDSLKPTASWVQNKSVVRLRDPATCGTDQSTSVSSPVLHAKLCQTSVTTLGPGICALTSVSVLTTKNRYDGTSPLRKSTTRQCGESKPKVTKVFWSEAQTLNQNQLGMSFPGAPPCTPTPELAQHYEYVASMTDIRAQRALRAHLDAIDQIQKRKAGRDREMQRKREKIYQKTQQIEAKKKQRSQIYALNKIMTEMEHKLFTEFCKQNIDTA